MPDWMIFPFKGRKYGPHWANFEENQNTMKAKGFRPVSLCIWGHPQDPRWAGVFHTDERSADWTDWECLHKGTAAELNAFQYKNLANYQPIIISATGTPPAARYLMVMVRRVTPLQSRPVVFGTPGQSMLVVPEMFKLDLIDGEHTDPSTYQYWNAFAFARGFILKSACIYGDPPRFAGIWWPNDEGITWDYSMNDHPSSHQKLFAAYAEGFMMPSQVTLSTNQRYLSIWTDQWFTPNWRGRHAISEADLEAEVDEVLAETAPGKKLWPLTLQANGIGEGVRYAVTFAEFPKTRPEPDVWTMTGYPDYRTPEGLALRTFDGFAQRYMRRRRIRAASLAITRYGKLVYAKGFTLAPPGYPITQPTTLFRIGSISKSITAIALFRIIDECIRVGLWPGKTTVATWLDTPLLAVLKRFGWPSQWGLIDLYLTLPGGNNALTAARWEQITLRDLLWHGAGLNPDLRWSYKNVLDAAVKGYDAYSWVVPFRDDIFLGRPPTYPIRFEWTTQHVAGLPDAINRVPGAKHQYGWGFIFLQLAIEGLVKAVYGDRYKGSSIRYKVRTLPEQDLPNTWYDRTYEKFVQEEILEPLGVKGPAFGAIHPYWRDFEPDCSYPPEAEARRERGRAVGNDPSNPEQVSSPWYVGPRWMIGWDSLRKGRLAMSNLGAGNWRLDGSHASWIFSAVDLVRLFASFDLSHSPILSDEAVFEMLSPAPLMDPDDLDKLSNDYFGVTKLHGFFERAGTPYRTGAWVSVAGSAPFYDPTATLPVQSFGHNGLMATGAARAMRQSDGFSFVFMRNTDQGPDPKVDEDVMWQLSERTRARLPQHWPSGDLFPIFGIPSFLVSPSDFFFEESHSFLDLA